MLIGALLVVSAAWGCLILRQASKGDSALEITVSYAEVRGVVDFKRKQRSVVAPYIKSRQGTAGLS